MLAPWEQERSQSGGKHRQSQLQSAAPSNRRTLPGSRAMTGRGRKRAGCCRGRYVQFPPISLPSGWTGSGSWKNAKGRQGWPHHWVDSSLRYTLSFERGDKLGLSATGALNAGNKILRQIANDLSLLGSRRRKCLVRFPYIHTNIAMNKDDTLISVYWHHHRLVRIRRVNKHRSGPSNKHIRTLGPNSLSINPECSMRRLGAGSDQPRWRLSKVHLSRRQEKVQNRHNSPCLGPRTNR